MTISFGSCFLRGPNCLSVFLGCFDFSCKHLHLACLMCKALGLICNLFFTCLLIRGHGLPSRTTRFLCGATGQSWHHTNWMCLETSFTVSQRARFSAGRMFCVPIMKPAPSGKLCGNFCRNQVPARGASWWSGLSGKHLSGSVCGGSGKFTWRASSECHVSLPSSASFPKLFRPHRGLPSFALVFSCTYAVIFL